MPSLQTVVLDELDLLMHGSSQQSVKLLLTALSYAQRHFEEGRKRAVPHDPYRFQIIATGATLPMTSKTSPVLALQNVKNSAAQKNKFKKILKMKNSVLLVWFFFLCLFLWLAAFPVCQTSSRKRTAQPRGDRERVFCDCGRL